MATPWKALIVKLTVWLAAEIVLNLIGLDNLADYSEFVFERDRVVTSHLPVATTLVVAQPQAALPLA